MASGNNRNGISSIFSPANLCFLVSTGFGLASLRLPSRADSIYAKADSLKSQLASAPTIPISSVNNHRFPNGQLVFLQNGVVSPLGKPLISSSNQEAVVIKIVENTDQPREFEHLYKGTQNVTVSSVPFSLVDPNEKSRCVFVKADVDYLRLGVETSVKSALDPPLYLSKKKKFSEIEEEEEKIQVSMVREEKRLGATNKMNVFGILRTSDREGRLFATIEPCPGFPTYAFTMTSPTLIEWMVKSGAFVDAFGLRFGSFLCGFAGVGYFYAGLACFAFDHR